MKKIVRWHAGRSGFSADRIVLFEPPFSPLSRVNKTRFLNFIGMHVDLCAKLTDSCGRLQEDYK